MNTGVQLPNNETDISIILSKRLEGIDNEMLDFTKYVYEFSVQAD